MPEKLKRGFDNYGEYWQIPGSDKKYRKKDEALGVGSKTEPKKKPKTEKRMKPIEISPERKKAEKALKMAAKKMALKDIKKKFPRGYDKMVGEAKKRKKVAVKDPAGKKRLEIRKDKEKFNRYKRHNVPPTMWDDDAKAEEWIKKHGKK